MSYDILQVGRESTKTSKAQTTNPRPKTSYQTSLHPSTMRCLTVTLEPLRVPVEPRGTRTSTLDTIGPMSTLAQPTCLPSGAGKSPTLAMLVHGVDNPIDTRVVAYPEMGGINQNNFVVFHGRVLVDPVGVENAQVGEFAPSLLLGNRLKIALELNLFNTLVLGLTKDHTTMVGTLASTTTDATPDNDISLLGLVAKTMGLVGTSGAVDAGDFGTLAVFPSADAKEETEGVTLLVTP
jgi:hypothetical protein